MSRLAKYLRLLPAVVIVGTGLLAIKSVDIARAAQAIAADPDQPDNSGLAPSSNGGAPAADYANDDGTNASPAEVDVQSSLTQRRTELDARERALNMRENVLTAGEARVDQKIAALKVLQSQIQTLLAQRDAQQDAQIASLVKTYSAMKPKDAARIFNSLSDEVLLPVAKGMKSDVLAPVLAAMNPDAAQKLTVKLAALLKLPDPATSAACPPASADAATLAPTASAAPAAPLQVAALTPPAVATPEPLPVPPAPPPQTAPAAPPTAAPAQAAATPHKPVPHKAPKSVAAKSTPAKPTAAVAAPPAAKPVVATTAVAPPPAPVPTPAAATPAAAKPAPQAATGPPAALAPPPLGG